MNKKKIVFLTGTRADFGKLKSLISITQKSEKYEVHIFVTGMHMNSVYGSTVNEVIESGFKNIFKFINHDSVENMDRTLARTIDGFSHYISQIAPDLIILHGDRVEAMAGSIVGSLNNILVAHIEGGEVSGTIDELIRHSISKMSHLHLVSNKEAKQRLTQLGEIEKSIYVLGSPDLDLMNPKKLPLLSDVKKYYEINFLHYAIAIFHPITTEYNNIKEQVKYFVDALIQSEKNYVVIYPNNDIGSNEILEEYKRLEVNDKFKIFPSLKFEYFLTLLKNANYIIGNSSAGIREAPYYKIPTIDIGTRQRNRSSGESIFHCDHDCKSIFNAITLSKDSKIENIEPTFGTGASDKMLLKILDYDHFWNTKRQKLFQDLHWKK
jgi:UDP-N-acetylglucosamine 2-epimerase (hydrolysing)